MFDQQKYVNSYIKENYRTIKLRIRKDDKLLMDKLSSVDNINKYISNLIRKDALFNRKHTYIDDSINIDFKLSHTMEDLVIKAEMADYNDDLGLYINMADAIDTQAKWEVTKHKMSEGQWNKLASRYCI